MESNDTNGTRPQGYWRSVASLTKQKLQELGAVGIVLGIIWLGGLWMWYVWAMDAYKELQPQAGQLLLGIMLVWLLVGLAIYLWRDPHHVRASSGGRSGPA